MFPVAASPRRSRGFLATFALAHAGGVIGYLPLLTVLLPIRIEAVAGEARIGVLTAAIVAGALAASVSNVVFGGLSDRAVARGGSRRRGIGWGLVLLALGCGGVAVATTPAQLVLAVAGFQVGVNAVLAPLFAIIADEIPDAQKGTAGGLLALGSPVASAWAIVLLAVSAEPSAWQFALIPPAAAACALPLLLGRPQPVAETRARAAGGRCPDLLLAWGSRLLVQVAGNVLSLYLLYYFESVASDRTPALLGAHMGSVLTIATVVALPIAVALGRLSDRTGRRKTVLLAALALLVAGLVAMALARDLVSASWAFGLYAVGLAAFLALHAGFAVQLLPDPQHRGRDLGLLNLANTLPALVGPLLTWALATPQDFAPLLYALAALAVGGGLLLLPAQGRQ